MTDESLSSIRHHAAHPEQVPDDDDLVEYVQKVNPTTNQVEVHAVPRQAGKVSVTRQQLTNQPIFDMPKMHKNYGSFVLDDWKTYSPGLSIDILRSLGAGAVIQWRMGPFTYVAVKVRDNWYTSATERNHSVEQILTTSFLANLLVDQPFGVAVRWEEVNAPPF